MFTLKQITILVAASLVVACGTAYGTNYLLFTNKAPAGVSWFTPENWRFTDPPNQQVLPTESDVVYIRGYGTAIVDGPGAKAGTLILGWDKGDPANMTLVPGGELYVLGAFTVGQYTPSQFVVSGGVLSGISKMMVGRYASTKAPGVVEVVQYAGSVLVTNGLYPAIWLNCETNETNYATGYPRYRLVDGFVQASYWYIGSYGYAKVEVEGGTNYVPNTIYVGHSTGGDGVYLQSGGLVKNKRMYLGNIDAQGRYELSGGLYEDTYYGIYCGYGGKGEFIQSGGTNNIAKGSIFLGTKSGTTLGTGNYQMSGGMLSVAQNIYVGHDGGTGTLEVAGTSPEISCKYYSQNADSTLHLRLTNSVAPIVVKGDSINAVYLDGTLKVTLLGEPYPERNESITIMTHPAKTTHREGTFATVVLEPADVLLDVRVNYNATSITLDQWKYAPKGTILTIR